MAGNKTYIVEHLDEELGPWSELEYIAIAKESQQAGSKFFLSSLPPAFKVPEALAAIPAFTAENRGVEELYEGQKSRVCLLDPAGKSDLAPEDGDKFDVFLFGGILGDDPPRDRTSELRKKGFEGRRLGPVQMTTDTAVRVTRLVVEGKTPLKDIEYLDHPELKFNEHESTEMPFRYVKGEDGKPIMPAVIKFIMAGLPPRININPPLVNSANPGATDLDQLRQLYEYPSTGAVTTRTSTLTGFPHDDAKHQWALFDPASHQQVHQNEAETSEKKPASLNTLGYSPHNFATYLSWLQQISDTVVKGEKSSKPFIVSVTGTAQEVVECYKILAETSTKLKFPVYLEINLSCPNIPDKPPPAYNSTMLLEYLAEIQQVLDTPSVPRIPFGLKTPPYTHSTEYSELFKALKYSAMAAGGVSPLSFITSTNTLGSCLMVSFWTHDPVLPGTGIGGMAGPPLHPLALGNVATIRRLLDESKESTGHVQIIGVGGVQDADGYERMKSVGASVVGVGTGLLAKGVGVFGAIEESLKGKWQSAAEQNWSVVLDY
ncbi:hypothetical protein QBC35DRAFT_512601 [Podospora australis]|uniref:Dihydroorotate dehydrogenase (fumarate) n=1 Tax=Podospora australis TaxID=1536484 RepID=A0AAN6X0A0_9PEZI|nr:hypothetical protein QBC35DRAFT_512601 [Podospora australis]